MATCKHVVSLGSHHIPAVSMFIKDSDRLQTFVYHSYCNGYTLSNSSSSSFSVEKIVKLPLYLYYLVCILVALKL